MVWDLIKVGQGLPPGLFIPQRGTAPVSVVNQYCLDFDGVDDNVRIGNVLNSYIEYNLPMSISAWIKTTDVGDNCIFSKQRVANERGFTLDLDSTNSRIYFTMYSNNTPAGTNSLEVYHQYAGSAYHDGNWHHVVLTKPAAAAASGIKIYVNAGSKAMTTVHDTLAATVVNTSAMLISGHTSSLSPTHPFTGRLKDVAFFSKELSAVEVQRIYGEGEPNGNVLLEETRGWWRLGDGTFDQYPTMEDYSVEVNPNNGLMVNMGPGDIVEDSP